MRNIKLYFYVIIIILFCSSTKVNAFTQDSQYEVSVNQLYKNIEKIIYPPKNIEDLTYQNSHIVLKNAIDIIKRSPNSPEAYLVLLFLDINFKLNNEAVQIYRELKNKYFLSLNDTTGDLAEKLVFIRVCLLFDVNVINAFPKENLKNTKKICYEALETIKNDCNDNNYAAIATIILFLFDRKKEKGYDIYFKNTFPEHSAIPYIELDAITHLASQNNFQKCIDETQKILLKHGNIVAPDGYAFKAECYNLLITCYMGLNDNTNAKKYFDLYEKELSLADPELLKSSYVEDLRNQVMDTNK